MEFQELGELRKKSAHVADQITEAIRSGSYRVGERLPSERTIARQMKVSRNCVREAISALQIIGVLESRAGYGTCIRKQSADPASIHQVLSLAHQGQALMEVWEARREVESSLLNLAIDRARPEDIARVERALGGLKGAAAAEDGPAYLKANKEFHQALASAARNAPLSRTLDTLLAVSFAEVREELDLSYPADRMRQSLQDHVRIAQALMAKDVAAGRRAVADHFADMNTYFRLTYLQDTTENT